MKILYSVVRWNDSFFFSTLSFQIYRYLLLASVTAWVSSCGLLHISYPGAQKLSKMNYVQHTATVWGWHFRAPSCGLLHIIVCSMKSPSVYSFLTCRCNNWSSNFSFPVFSFVRNFCRDQKTSGKEIYDCVSLNERRSPCFLEGMIIPCYCLTRELSRQS